MSTEEEATIQIISRQNNTGRRQNTWARNMFGNSGFISLYWQGGRVMEKKKPRCKLFTSVDVSVKKTVITFM